MRCFAQVLADAASSLIGTDLKALTSDIEKAYISKEYEATLLSHQGFDPLGWLIAEQVPGFAAVKPKSAFAECAGIKGVAGSIHLGEARSTLVNWQSATDEGKDHKVKELCGRAVALRYTWDAKSKSFVPRAGVKKLCLVVDGTWTQEDLDTLVRAGWDEIFYPDEMDKLAKAIV